MGGGNDGCSVANADEFGELDTKRVGARLRRCSSWDGSAKRAVRKNWVTVIMRPVHEYQVNLLGLPKMYAEVMKTAQRCETPYRCLSHVWETRRVSMIVR